MIYTKNLKIAKGSRPSVAMKLKDFEKKLKEKIVVNLVSDGWDESDAREAVDEDDLGGFVTDIIDMEKDISVDFAEENIACDDDFMSWDESESGSDIYDILGFHEENGFCWLGVNAGGDWEDSVFFIVYYDGTKFRGYVPEMGNIFNTMTMEALGNNDSDPEDAEASVRLMKEDFLSTIEISGIPIIDMINAGVTKTLEDAPMMIVMKDSLEEFLTAVNELSDDDMIKEIVKDFANKNNIKIK